MTLQEAEVALHELFVYRPSNAAVLSAGILMGVDGELDNLSSSTQRELQLLVLEEKLEAGIIDEDVAGLVESLFNADDSVHEQLHLAVRTQAFLRKKGALHGQEAQCLLRQATEVLFEPPDHCQNRSLCDSLAALRAAAEQYCPQLHGQTGDIATQDAEPGLTLRATWERYPLFYAQQLLKAALESERIRLTDPSSTRQKAGTAPSACSGRGAARRLACGMQGAAGAATAEAEGPVGVHGSVIPSTAQGAAPAQSVPAPHSESQHDDFMRAQQRLSLSIPFDSDIDVGGTPPPLPPPAIRPDWASPGSRAGTAAVQRANLGCIGLQTSQEQMALVPDTYEDLNGAQQVPELASSEITKARSTGVSPETDDVENSSLHSNGGLRLSGSSGKTGSQQAKHAQHGIQAQGQAGWPHAQHARHGSDGREPAGHEGTPPEDTPYSSPIESSHRQQEHPAAGGEPSAPTKNDKDPQDTPYSSPAEGPLDQAAPDQAPLGPPPAGRAADGDLSEDEVFEDAAQTLLDLRTQPSGRPGPAQAADPAENDEDLHARQQTSDGAAAHGEAAATSPMQHRINVLRNVTDAQPHASFGSGPLFPSPADDILDMTGEDQEDGARGRQRDLARMTITQKPAAVAQPRRRQDRRPVASGEAVPAPCPPLHPGTDHEAVPQRRTARKRMGAAAGSNAAAASPVLAPSPSSAVPAPQKSQASNMIRPRTLEQPQGAPPAQRPGPSASGQQQQPAPFDLSAAMRGRQSGQAPSTVASPDQARQAGHSIPPPAVAARTVPEAQTQRPAHQASAGHALAPAQAMGRSELPQQTFGLLGKRAAEPGHEPPAKRAKRSDGSLLGLANMVIRDFARRRLGGAAGNPSGAATPPAAAGASRGAATPPLTPASRAAATPAASCAGAAASAAPVTPATVTTASMRAVVEAAIRLPGSVAVPTLVPERFRRANARANSAIRQIRKHSPLPPGPLGMLADGSGLPQTTPGSSAQPSLSDLTGRAHRQQGHHPGASRQPDQAPLQGAVRTRNSPVLEQPLSRLRYEAGPPLFSTGADGVQSRGHCADLPAEMGPQDIQPVGSLSWPQWAARLNSNTSRAAPQPGTYGHAGQPTTMHRPPSQPASGQGYMQLPLVSTRGLSGAFPTAAASEQRPEQARTPLSQGLTAQTHHQASGTPAYPGHRSSAWQGMATAQQPIAAVAASDPVLQHMQHGAFSNAAFAAGPSVRAQTSSSQANSGCNQQPMSPVNWSALPAGASAVASQHVLIRTQPRRLTDPTMLYHRPLQTMRDAPRPGISPTELWRGFERPFTAPGTQ